MSLNFNSLPLPSQQTTQAAATETDQVVVRERLMLKRTFFVPHNSPCPRLDTDSEINPQIPDSLKLLDSQFYLARSQNSSASASETLSSSDETTSTSSTVLSNSRAEQQVHL